MNLLAVGTGGNAHPTPPRCPADRLSARLGLVPRRNGEVMNQMQLLVRLQRRPSKSSVRLRLSFENVVLARGGCVPLVWLTLPDRLSLR